MNSIHTTKSRYFALGLFIWLLAVPHLLELVLPQTTNNPKMWIEVKTAIIGGSLFLIFIGSVGGFALSRNILSPIRSFVIALLYGALVVGAHMLVASDKVSLEGIAASSLIFGFVGGWAIASILGKSPNTSFKGDALTRAP